MAIPIPDDVRELLQPPRYVHLSTLRADGPPRNWVICAGQSAGETPAVWRLTIRRSDDRDQGQRLNLPFEAIAGPRCPPRPGRPAGD
jgi:hypothetical protein